MRREPGILTCLLTILLLLVQGCATGKSYNRAPLPEPEALDPSEIEATIFLIGDAGKPDSALLATLTADASSSASDTVKPRIVFLGDNIYEEGLPPETDSDYAEAQRRIDAQLETARRSAAVGIFTPGNHDWDNTGDEGWERVVREGEYVDRNGGIMLPKGGCPGPTVHDVGRRLRLILLDTDWWLHDGRKPTEATPGQGPHCGALTQTGVTQRLRAVLEESHSAGRDVVVAAHHPLASGSRHGGYWSVSDFFLLSGNLKWYHTIPAAILAGVAVATGEEWLLAPAIALQVAPPVARILGRRFGFSRHQDLSDSWYRTMRDSLRDAFAQHPPLAYAAGHDHNLQVIEDGPEGYTLVSGAGSHGKLTAVKVLETTVCKEVKPGYMRLDVPRDLERQVVLTLVVFRPNRPARATCRMRLERRQ